VSRPSTDASLRSGLARPGAASPRSVGFLQEGVQFALPFFPVDATVFRRGSFGRGCVE
jgi:hypothetical protein